MAMGSLTGTRCSAPMSRATALRSPERTPPSISTRDSTLAAASPLATAGRTRSRAWGAPFRYAIRTVESSSNIAASAQPQLAKPGVRATWTPHSRQEVLPALSIVENPERFVDRREAGALVIDIQRLVENLADDDGHGHACLARTPVQTPALLGRQVDLRTLHTSTAYI